MMNEMNNSWGMGFGYGWWIIAIIVLVFVIWLVVKVVNKKKQ